MSFGKEITFCFFSISFFVFFSSMLFLMPALRMLITVPVSVVAHLFFGITTSSSSSSSYSSSTTAFLEALVFAFGSSHTLRELMLIAGSFGSFIFHAQTIQASKAIAITIIIILIAHPFSGPKTLWNSHKMGHDIYHPCSIHCVLLNRRLSVSKGKFRIADTRIVVRTHCFTVVEIIHSLISTPIPHKIQIMKNTDSHCSPKTTEKTLVAISRIGDHFAKNNAKKYNPHIIRSPVQNCFLEIAMVRLALFLVFLLAKIFSLLNKHFATKHSKQI